MQLIDKDDLIKRIQQRYKENYKSYHVSEYHEGLCDAYYAIHSFLAQQPAIEERRHGHWIATAKCYPAAYVALRYYKCSVCGDAVLEDPDFGLHNYCPKKKKKMDEVTK